MNIQQAEMERDRAIREARRLWKALDRLLTALRPMQTSKFDGLLGADEFIKAKDNASDALDPKPQLENVPTDKQLLKEAKAENQRLREHAGEAPSLDRIREAHSWMTRDSWIEPDGVGHRVYCQNMDEQCYLCAVIALLDKANAENKRLQEAL